jgi:hypothetical protein
LSDLEGVVYGQACGGDRIVGAGTARVGKPGAAAQDGAGAGAAGAHRAGGGGPAGEQGNWRNGGRGCEHSLGYIDTVNADPRPFRWTKSAGDILGTIKRFCLRTLEITDNQIKIVETSETGHQSIVRSP